MEAKEILEKVKLFFNELIAPTPVAAAASPTPVAAAASPTPAAAAASPTPAAAAASPTPAPTPEYELKIGGKVTIDKLEVGGMVMIDDAPALPGDIELTDGTMITVGDNGVISAITAPTAAPAPGMDMGEKFTAFETTTNEKFAAYETKFAAYEQRFADYEAKMSKANKVIEELLKLSTLIVEAPAAAPDGSASTAGFAAEPEKKKYSPILFN